MLVDQHLNVGVALCNQSNGICSGFSRSIATSRARDVNSVTLFSFEGHLFDQISQNEVLFIGGNNFITPNSGMKLAAEVVVTLFVGENAVLAMIKFPKLNYRTRPSEYACMISSLNASYLDGSVILRRIRSVRL